MPRFFQTIFPPTSYDISTLLISDFGFNTSQGLTNMINTEHAVFGAFGLGAGVIHWLQLRGLFPAGVARWLWPSLVIGLGLFMAFCYSEVE